MQGTIKNVKERGDFGFIAPDEGGGDVFIHVSAVAHLGIKSLVDGWRVSFDIGPGKAGKTQAVNVAML